MLYVLHPSLLVAQNQAGIDALLHAAVRKKCYVNIAATNSAEYIAWWATQTQNQRSSWQTMFDWAVQDQAVFHLAEILVEQRATSDWASDTPRVTLDDAINLIDTPFRFFVENARNDRAFFLTMVDSRHRPFIEWKESSNQLEFENGGGITELRNLLTQKVNGRPERILKAWVLFDSDGDVPGALSADAVALRDECIRLNVPYTCLPRRAIENYLPKGALYEYVDDGPHRSRHKRQAQIDAFYAMTDAQRFHFHMKDGFGPRLSAAAHELYASVDDLTKRQLDGGISRKLAELYKTMDKSKLRNFVVKEGCDADLQGPWRLMLRRLRVPYA